MLPGSLWKGLNDGYQQQPPSAVRGRSRQEGCITSRGAQPARPTSVLAALRMCNARVSRNEEPQNRPQYAMILIVRTSNPQFLKTPRLQECSILHLLLTTWASRCSGAMHAALRSALVLGSRLRLPRLAICQRAHLGHSSSKAHRYTSFSGGERVKLTMVSTHISDIPGGVACGVAASWHSSGKRLPVFQSRTDHTFQASCDQGRLLQLSRPQHWV